MPVFRGDVAGKDAFAMLPRRDPSEREQSQGITVSDALAGNSAKSLTRGDAPSGWVQGR